MSDLLSQEPASHLSEELHEIITRPPGWLVRWGLIIFFAILILLFGLAAFIRYPDLVKTTLVVSSVDKPKPVISRVTGKLSNLLVQENQAVTINQPLAYLESTANHEQVLSLLNELKRIQNELLEQSSLSSLSPQFNLGELQSDYQSFHQAYLTYKGTVDGGFYLKKRAFLQKELETILRQRSQIERLKALQEKDYILSKQEYETHKMLFEQKVLAQMEFQREESKFLTKSYPLQETNFSLLVNNTNYSAKEKEILELDNQIYEEKSRFTQAINSLVSRIENWKSLYILNASQSGSVEFTGVIQEKQFVIANDVVFFINSGNSDFFGDMAIPQYNMGKVEEGQEVLVKLKSFPYEEFGLIRGEIVSIAEVPSNDGSFFSKVRFKEDVSSLKKQILLKNGMTADAEIITEDASLLRRILRNILKILK